MCGVALGEAGNEIPIFVIPLEDVAKVVPPCIRAIAATMANPKP